MNSKNNMKRNTKNTKSNKNKMSSKFCEECGNQIKVGEVREIGHITVCVHCSSDLNVFFGYK